MERIGIYVFGELPWPYVVIIKLIPIIVIVVLSCLSGGRQKKKATKNGQDAKPDLGAPAGGASQDDNNASNG